MLKGWERTFRKDLSGRAQPRRHNEHSQRGARSRKSRTSLPRKTTTPVFGSKSGQSQEKPDVCEETTTNKKTNTVITHPAWCGKGLSKDHPVSSIKSEVVLGSAHGILKYLGSRSSPRPKLAVISRLTWSQFPLLPEHGPSNTGKWTTSYGRLSIWGFPKTELPQKWMVYFRENPIKMDDLGVPLF